MLFKSYFSEEKLKDTALGETGTKPLKLSPPPPPQHGTVKVNTGK